VFLTVEIPDTEGMTTISENKASVGDYIDALFNEGDLYAGDRYLSPEFVNHEILQIDRSPSWIQGGSGECSVNRLGLSRQNGGAVSV
jgi:hypothetical protein